jgi:predicted Rossmann fold nucleotide-binding protein DprA/Smf involved in DNA uptake
VAATRGTRDPAAPTDSALPDEAHVAALARLPRVGPARRRAMLDRYGPRGAWNAVLAGTVDPAVVVSPGRDDPRQLVASWRRSAAAIEPGAYWQAHLDAGIGVAARGSSAFPAPLADDDDPPAVIFWQGDLDHLAGVRAAVVGTRRATRYGLDVAHDLGGCLAEAGVAVVSGLALGIDGAVLTGIDAVEAARRGVPVLAVPGPVTAASSDGTNQLLFDGCPPARDATDVLLALGREPARTRRAAERRPRPEGDAKAVLAEVPWGPVAAETLALATGLDLGRLALALDRLEADGWVARRGGWIERLGRPAGGT